MYIDADGNKYESYKDYVNSPELDSYTIFIKLLSGVRTPQNDEEKKMKEWMDEMHAQGKIIETDFNF